MFIYDLLTHAVEGDSVFNGEAFQRTAPGNVIQQSGDAVVWVFPYNDSDTFNFKNQAGKPVSLVENKPGEPPLDPNIVTAAPVKLDPWLTTIDVIQTKDSHQGSLTMTMLDPENNTLTRCSPGDWVFCWMFDNHSDGQLCRKALENGDYSKLNSFKSGLKFVGKLFSVRKHVSAIPTGGVIKRVQVIATSFSEFDTGIYFDPQLTDNLGGGLEWMAAVSMQMMKKWGLAEDVNKLLADFVGVFMGMGLLDTRINQGQMSRAMKIPSIVGKVLGDPLAKYYVDILRTYMGVQQFSNSYLPDGLSDAASLPFVKASSQAPYKTFRYSPIGLAGYNSQFIAPFANVPMWSVIQQYCNRVVNEAYTTLKVGEDGRIHPSLVIRQIPFNTDDFIKQYAQKWPATAFRSLPRWKVRDENITQFSVGKSDSLRVNFVRVQPKAEGHLLGEARSLLARNNVHPSSDKVDIERNGLRAQAVSIDFLARFDLFIVLTEFYTYLLTDRAMGGHLKYSGSVSLTGVQEPIAVGDNLQYDNLLYHIEQVQHNVTLDPLTGQKSFSTTLAISNGVPAAGPVLPEIDVRDTQEVKKGRKTVSSLLGTSQSVKSKVDVSTTSKKDGS